MDIINKGDGDVLIMAWKDDLELLRDGVAEVREQLDTHASEKLNYVCRMVEMVVREGMTSARYQDEANT